MKIGHHYKTNNWTCLIERPTDTNEYGNSYAIRRPAYLFVVDKRLALPDSGRTPYKVMTSDQVLGWMLVRRRIDEALDTTGRWESDSYYIKEIKAEDS